MQQFGEKGELSSERLRRRAKQMRKNKNTYTVWNQHGSKGIHNQYQTTADNRITVKYFKDKQIISFVYYCHI